MTVLTFWKNAFLLPWSQWFCCIKQDATCWVLFASEYYCYMFWRKLRWRQEAGKRPNNLPRWRTEAAFTWNTWKAYAWSCAMFNCFAWGSYQINTAKCVFYWFSVLWKSNRGPDFGVLARKCIWSLRRTSSPPLLLCMAQFSLEAGECTRTTLEHYTSLWTAARLHVKRRTPPLVTDSPPPELPPPPPHSSDSRSISEHA